MGVLYIILYFLGYKIPTQSLGWVLVDVGIFWPFFVLSVCVQCLNTFSRVHKFSCTPAICLFFLKLVVGLEVVPPVEVVLHGQNCSPSHNYI